MTTQILKNWRTVRLQEIADVRDGTHDTPEKQEIGKPLITSRQLKNGSILSTDYFITDDDFELVNKRSKVDKNDVLISMIGTIGDTVFIKNKPDFAIKNIGLIKNKDSITGRFIFYWLNSPAGKYEIDKRLRGTSQRFISLGSLRELEIELPDYPTQKQIVDVLSAYDDLIENNSRRIQILEQLAQEIYKEWFVNFRFPGHEKVKMIDSGTDFGKIPEGWEIEKVKDFVDFARGFEPGSKNYQEQHGEGLIPFLRVGDLGNRQSKIFIKKELVGDRVLNKDDIVISMDGSVGIVRMGLEGAYSSGIRKIIIKSKALNKPFVWQLLLSEDIQNMIKEHARGTTILHAGESINQMEFVLPTDRIMKEFFDKEELIMKLLSDLTDQNQNLRQTRDLLLPKLVTGEVEVR